MNPAVVLQQRDTEKLMEEIDRYLAVVDLFRSENCELTWRPEIHAEVAVLEPHRSRHGGRPRHPPCADHEVDPTGRVSATWDVLSARREH